MLQNARTGRREQLWGSHSTGAARALPFCCYPPKEFEKGLKNLLSKAEQNATRS
jgi:hypothetical protein